MTQSGVQGRSCCGDGQEEESWEVPSLQGVRASGGEVKLEVLRSDVNGDRDPCHSANRTPPLHAHLCSQIKHAAPEICMTIHFRCFFIRLCIDLTAYLVKRCMRLLLSIKEGVIMQVKDSQGRGAQLHSDGPTLLYCSRRRGASYNPN